MSKRVKPLPLTLPPPKRGHLPRSPLQLVACQVRYADPKRPISASIAAEVVQELEKAGHHYPKVEPVQISSLNLNLSPAGLQSSASVPVAAFRLLTEDARWIVTLAPDAISLETPRYGRWEKDFREHLLSVLSIVAKLMEPSVTSRIGLRYVDLLVETDVKTPMDWKGRISDLFLGPLSDELLVNSIQVSQQQLSLRLADDLRGTLRHGVFLDQSAEPPLRYLIDTDVYWDSFSPYNLEKIRERLEEMHTASTQIFQRVITADYYEELKKAK